jgi:hypothetical protein
LDFSHVRNYAEPRAHEADFVRGAKALLATP